MSESYFACGMNVEIISSFAMTLNKPVDNRYCLFVADLVGVTYNITWVCFLFG